MTYTFTAFRKIPHTGSRHVNLRAVGKGEDSDIRADVYIDYDADKQVYYSELHVSHVESTLYSLHVLEDTDTLAQAIFNAGRELADIESGDHDTEYRATFATDDYDKNDFPFNFGDVAADKSDLQLREFLHKLPLDLDVVDDQIAENDFRVVGDAEIPLYDHNHNGVSSFSEEPEQIGKIVVTNSGPKQTVLLYDGDEVVFSKSYWSDGESAVRELSHQAKRDIVQACCSLGCENELWNSISASKAARARRRL